MSLNAKVALIQANSHKLQFDVSAFVTQVSMFLDQTFNYSPQQAFGIATDLIAERFLVNMDTEGPFYIEYVDFDYHFDFDEENQVVSFFVPITGRNVTFHYDLENQKVIELPYHAPAATEAIHKHDCDCCEYLGTVTALPDAFAPSAIDYDLYFCAQGGIGPTVIARYGSEGPQYSSGIGFPHNALKVAEFRAVRRGLMHPTEDSLLQG